MSRSPPLGADPADLAAVESIVRSAGTSFYQGMRVLSPHRRYAMYAIYAFCRLVDDIADEGGTLAEKQAGLQAWAERIDAVYAGRADGPVTRLLLAAVPMFDLRAADFHAVIDGMRTDAEQVVVAPSLQDLELYCDRVAVAVGRLSVRAFGDASPAADRVAHALGRALQFTNILRDVKEDAERGRIYLPKEWLNDAAVTPDPATICSAPGLPLVCERMARAAHDYFAVAAREMVSCNPAAMRPARLMGATYDALLTAIERRGWRRLDERVGLPAWRKLWLACRYGLI